MYHSQDILHRCRHGCVCHSSKQKWKNHSNNCFGQKSLMDAQRKLWWETEYLHHLKLTPHKILIKRGKYNNLTVENPGRHHLNQVIKLTPPQWNISTSCVSLYIYHEAHTTTSTLFWPKIIVTWRPSGGTSTTYLISVLQEDQGHERQRLMNWRCCPRSKYTKGH